MDGKIIEKTDQTPVTVADFEVQALVSLEMSKLFPSIPLVAEEDSEFVRENNLVDAVVQVVTDNFSKRDEALSQDDVLKAIDRGGKYANLFGLKPATYWILDPIDGTRGFVKGGKAQYVVGLALVVEGEIVLGVMGCPNWQDGDSTMSHPDSQNTVSGLGIIMISHVGCGTWRTTLWDEQNGETESTRKWTRCLVDSLNRVREARFCIPESQTWEPLPLFSQFNSTAHADSVGEKNVFVLSACCGSLCKYLMVASGRASVFFLRATTKSAIKVWDHAVGVMCIHEAGGKVTDWNGRKLDFSADQTGRRVLYPSGGILVTNDSLHNRILEFISSG